MGRAPMNYLNTSAILITVYLAAFLEAWPGGLRHWLATQVDVLPSIMVYCGLSTSVATMALTAVLGGLWFDTLSANPLGTSILPLFAVGFVAERARDLVLKDQIYAQVLLGVAGSAAAPLIAVLLLWGGGYNPLIGWGSLWQWLVMAGAGGILTPVCFWFFGCLNAALAYRRQADSTFRPDREIKRGRA